MPAAAVGSAAMPAMPCVCTVSTVAPVAVAAAAAPVSAERTLARRMARRALDRRAPVVDEHAPALEAQVQRHQLGEPAARADLADTEFSPEHTGEAGRVERRGAVNPGRGGRRIHDEDKEYPGSAVAATAAAVASCAPAAPARSDGLCPVPPEPLTTFPTRAGSATRPHANDARRSPNTRRDRTQHARRLHRGSRGDGCRVGRHDDQRGRRAAAAGAARAPVHGERGAARGVRPRRRRAESTATAATTTTATARPSPQQATKMARATTTQPRCSRKARRRRTRLRTRSPGCPIPGAAGASSCRRAPARPSRHRSSGAPVALARTATARHPRVPRHPPRATARGPRSTPSARPRSRWCSPAAASELARSSTTSSRRSATRAAYARGFTPGRSPLCAARPGRHGGERDRRVDANLALHRRHSYSSIASAEERSVLRHTHSCARGASDLGASSSAAWANDVTAGSDGGGGAPPGGPSHPCLEPRSTGSAVVREMGRRRATGTVTDPGIPGASVSSRCERCASPFLRN